MFYVDIRNTDFYNFYYNMASVVEEHVQKIVGQALDNRPTTKPIGGSWRGGLAPRGTQPKEWGLIGAMRVGTDKIDYVRAMDVHGIAGIVAENIAEQVLEKAYYYCPKDTGALAATGRIIATDDNTYMVVFGDADAPYAWYVHEFSWKKHKFPECSHFLTRAIYEVEKSMGYGWY